MYSTESQKDYYIQMPNTILVGPSSSAHVSVQKLFKVVGYRFITCRNANQDSPTIHNRLSNMRRKIRLLLTAQRSAVNNKDRFL